MKVLNLYAGIGGNRKLWEDVSVTAVEWDEDVAKVYQDYFPEDEVIIADAHQYLLDHYQEFDFIWSSPPCPTHSRARMWGSKGWDSVSVKYPDMKLYQEIILLTYYFDNKWVVENVDPFYQPLIIPTKKIGKHIFWSNFRIGILRNDIPETRERRISHLKRDYGLGIGINQVSNKTKVLRNCVHPEIGRYILNRAKGIYEKQNDEQMTIFSSNNNS